MIKFLRKEKDIAVARLDVIVAERDRLRHQTELAEKQLEEAQTNIQAEREKAQVRQYICRSILSVMKCISLFFNFFFICSRC